MKNARFTWTYPTNRQRGGALDPADVVGAELSLRVVGAPDWTVLATPAFPVVEANQADMVEGDYEARLVILTDAAVRGAPATIAFRVADDSAAEAASDFAVELT